MKNLHKKISAVALIAVLGAPVLSQGLVISSNSSSPNKKVISYEEFQNRIYVERYEDEYRYYYVYLESLEKGEKEDLNYPDRWEFVKGLKRGDLDEYRNKQESIIIKVGKSYFRIYLLMPQHQRDRIIVKECAKKYGFNIEYCLSNSVEMDALIRSKFKNKPEVMKQLLKHPSEYGVNLFPDGDSFRVALQLGRIHFEKGKYYRYRIGIYDYIFYKN